MAENPSNELKFALFADLHYKKGMYIASVGDVESILSRANENGVDFVIHCGDMCNDYKGSRELTSAYLENPYKIPAYGIYGNHELETKENDMSYVTPLLTNREVVWGTPDGKISDGSIAYYHFDINGFRIVCVDTNYSFNVEIGLWEHNLPASWGAPIKNIKANSLGDAQLVWLENLLDDAADKGLKCLIFSHESFSGVWSRSPDTDTVREMFRKVNKKREKTVLMAVNGHLHTNHQKMIEDILFIDVNTVRNGLWIPKSEVHYTDETFLFADYDKEGREISKKDRLVSDLWMSAQTWYYSEPLSAIVTVTSDGKITVDGKKSTWYAGVDPSSVRQGVSDEITSAEYVV